MTNPSLIVADERRLSSQVANQGEGASKRAIDLTQRHRDEDTEFTEQNNTGLSSVHSVSATLCLCVNLTSPDAPPPR